MTRRAVVIGAGIAGLGAAHALAEVGYEVRVLERDSELRAEGAGLTLWPNASRALEAVGLAEVIPESALVLKEAVTLTPAGVVVSRVPLDRIAKRLGPLVSAHRADLLHALRKRVKSGVSFGTGVSTKDGELYALGEMLQEDLIIGADGIGSTVRELIAPNIAPRGAGYAAWRGVALTGEETPAIASETMGLGKRFGLVPLKGGRTYWFAVLTNGSASDNLEMQFANWHSPISEVLAATPDAARSYLSLRDLPPLPRWHRDRMVLIGDAAHAMTPNLGQGAAQALEDVAALAQTLRERQQPEALGAFELIRKRRAERIVRQSRTVGLIAQTSNPTIAYVRNLLSRHIPAPLAAHQFLRVLDG